MDKTESLELRLSPQDLAYIRAAAVAWAGRTNRNPKRAVSAWMRDRALAAARAELNVDLGAVSGGGLMEPSASGQGGDRGAS